MKILIAGNGKVGETLADELSAEGYDLTLIDNDAKVLSACLERFDVMAVRGNCDSEVDQMLLQFPVLSTYAVVVDNGRRLFLTHGHVFNEENLPACKHDFFFYGHTHLWKLEQDDSGQVVCNTGSVTFPKGGNEPTFAIYEDGHVEMRRLDGSVVKKL